MTIFRDVLCNTVKRINEEILAENRSKQEISVIGTFRLGNLFLHQNVEKLETKKKGGRKVHCIKISASTLVDGIHVNKNISLKWYQAMLYNYMKFYDWIEIKTQVAI